MKRIAAELGVSPATVHAWTRDIELTDEQRARNARGSQRPDQVARWAAAWRRRSRERRLASQESGRGRARDRDPLHMAGCMLYWAEGTKGRNVLTLSNSDAQMLRFFGRFLRTSLDVKSEDMRIRLNVYTNNDLTLQEIETYWLVLLGLGRSSLRGHSLNHYPTSSSGRRRAKLPYGVCTLSVARSTHLVQHIYGAIQEYGGFERPGWLD